MSDDPTRDIGGNYTTQPTIQTVLERLTDFRAFVETRFEAVDNRLISLEARTGEVREELRRLSNQFDRFTAVAHDARAGVRELEDRVMELENK